MARRLKELLSEDLNRCLEGVEDAIFVDFSGLSATEDYSARKEFREAGISVNVVKNSLLKRVLEERGTPLPEEAYGCPLALLSGETDAIAASKKVAEWRRSNKKKMPIKGGLLEGEVLGPEGAEQLTKMLSVQETRQVLVSAVAGPLIAMVGIAQNLLTGVPGVVQAIVDKKKEEGE
ncbi:MAG TPA: 50S ribosomal protein L10 [Planctomycetes bacterium]|nr:50S ribosomal protein L10 [Planctomycetota bacterium]HIN79809.1 50S ribosomal protein L10 [Planctomycetota bacterium]